MYTHEAGVWISANHRSSETHDNNPNRSLLVLEGIGQLPFASQVKAFRSGLGIGKTIWEGPEYPDDPG
jgi:hypothetical protein